MIDLALMSKNFHGHEILRDIHIKMKPSERIALLGPSGIGKTSLIRILAGLDQDFKGRYHAPKDIALMFQEPNLLPWRNVQDNLQIFHPKTPRSEILARLEDVGLNDKATHFPSQLSLGQQRRLALLRTFMTPVDLVLLDEPFASLDNATSNEMVDLTANLLEQNNSALILVTHNEDTALRLGAKVFRLTGKPAMLA